MGLFDIPAEVKEALAATEHMSERMDSLLERIEETNRLLGILVTHFTEPTWPKRMEP
jgi:hypothetical protein